MPTWKTVIQLNVKAVFITTPEIKIKCGIFQGDSLSPLWLCLALNPLYNRQLKRTRNRVRSGRRASEAYRITPTLLYIDDLKLYAPSHDKLKKLIMVVETFSKDISMTFGLEKCTVINIEKGTDGGLIESMLEEGSKYLGYQQAKTIDHISVKKNFLKKYLFRMNSVQN